MDNTVTHNDIDNFCRELGGEEYLSRQNYFRWMEYPLALTMLGAEKGMRVLEIGTGIISHTPLFLAAKRGCIVTAIDMKVPTDEDLAYLEGVKKRLGIPDENLRYLTMDAAKLEFEDESFDRALAISMIEHLPLFTDAKVMNELGRVLKKNGRLVFTVPFNLGHHIEEETWHGSEYQQRHYNDFTVRERLIVPTKLHFVRAVAFGEIDERVGEQYVAMSDEEKVQFCLENNAHPEKYWREYYDVGGDGEFIIHKPKIPEQFQEQAGVVAMKLEKQDKPLPRSYFEYMPLRSYLENQRLCKTPENWPVSLQIEKIELLNSWDNEQYVYESGQSMTVKINFRCFGELINPAFFLIFQDDYGNIVAGMNTHQAGIDLGHITGKHRITVEIGMLNLMPGAFDLTVGAWEYDWPNPIAPFPFDVKYKAFRLEIKERQKGLFGAVYLPYRLSSKKI